MEDKITAFTVTVFPNGVSTTPGWRFKGGILMTPQTYGGDPVRFGVRSSTVLPDEVKTQVVFDASCRRCVDGSTDERISIALMFVGNLHVSSRFVQDGTIQSLMTNTKNEYRVAMISLQIGVLLDFTIRHRGEGRKFRLLYDSVNGNISLTNRDLAEDKPANRSPRSISWFWRLITRKGKQSVS